MSEATKKTKKTVSPKSVQRWSIWAVDVRRFATITRAIGKILGRKISKDGVLIIAPMTEDDEALAIEIGDFLKAQRQTMQNALIAENARIADRRERQRIARGGKPH